MQRLSLDTSTLRVRSLEVMKAFCSETLRLPLLLLSDTTAVFELGTDRRGNTQVLMLAEEDREGPPQHLALETSGVEFSQACQHLLNHGAYLFQSENSSAPGCAWRVLSCSTPEGHRIVILNIDPARCSPVSPLHGEAKH